MAPDFYLGKRRHKKLPNGKHVFPISWDIEDTFVYAMWLKHQGREEKIRDV